MKELIHFTMTGSTVCQDMIPIINNLVKNNPDIIYSKINVDEDHSLYDFYSIKYDLSTCPVFLGIVDGKLQDGHIGSASVLILESLVN